MNSQGGFIEQINGVNWPLIFYVSFAIAAYVLLNRLTDFSIEKIIKTLGEEFRDVLTLNPKPTAINAAGVILIVLFIIVYMVNNNFREFADIVAGISTDTKLPEPDNWVLYISLFAMAIILLGSLLAVRKP